MEEPLVSVVIPAFNEEDNVSSVLHATHKVLKRMGLSYEIVVVNDGSTDRTAEVAGECGVVLVNNGRNMGKGDSLKAGFLRAKGRFIVTMDADGSHQPDDIPNVLYPVLNGNSLEATIGSRFTDDIGRNSTTRLHLVGNKIINALILFLVGRCVSDSQSGFRAFRREDLPRLALHSSGYEIESEMTIRMLKNGFRVKDVPIRCRQRKTGSTNINSFSDGFKIFKAIVKATFCS